MKKIIPIDHPDFIKQKLTVKRTLFGPLLLCNNKIMKRTSSGKLKVIDDHGQERILNINNFLSPTTLVIDDKENIVFGQPLPKFTYLLLLPSISFITCGAIGSAAAIVNLAFILSMCHDDISAAKKCIYALLSTVGLYGVAYALVAFINILSGS